LNKDECNKEDSFHFLDDIIEIEIYLFFELIIISSFFVCLNNKIMEGKRD